MSFYAARQPILSADKKLFGYELLFRTSFENIFPKIDEDRATSKMLDGLYFDLSLDKIAHGKTAFINFTDKSLFQHLPVLLPRDAITIEVLESVQPSSQILSKFELLHEHGYTIALDDFIHKPAWEPFYKFCNFIKVDCLAIDDEQLGDIIALSKRHPHLQLLAEKVEDNATFIRFKSLGFSLFQGYFFAKPEVIKSVSLTASQTRVSSLLEEVSRCELDNEKLTQIFENDAALSYRLLRYVQAPIFLRRKQIDSIKQALVLLGQKELQRFVTLLFAATFAEDKPNELIRLSLQRAKFCELFSAKIDECSESSSFLLGMMSLIDAMLDADLCLIVDGLPLSNDIKQALLNGTGRMSMLLQMCQHLEKGQFHATQLLCKKNNIDMAEVCAMQLLANNWADTGISMLT